MGSFWHSWRPKLDPKGRSTVIEGCSDDTDIAMYLPQFQYLNLPAFLILSHVMTH